MNKNRSHTSRESGISRRASIVLSVILIAAAGFLVYLTSLGGEFIWDDVPLIRDNAYTRSWDFLPEIFTSDMGAGAGLRYNYYRPLAVVTFLADRSFWDLNVTGYHLSNILFHVLAAVAVYFLVDRLFADRLLALLTALLWVVHPAHTEAVAYISSRADSLCAFFMIACFLFYLRCLRRGGALAFVLMISSCVLAALTRENFVVLPGLLLAYHAAFRERVRLRLFLPLAVVATAYVIIRSYILGPVASPTTLTQRLPGAFAAIAGYLRVIAWPVGLHHEYGLPPFSYSDAPVILGMAIVASSLVACGILAVKPLKKPRGPSGGGRLTLFGVLWFYAALLPVSGLYPLKAYMADHWLYVPSIGVFLLAAYALRLMAGTRGLKAAAWVCTAGLLLGYGILTARQNAYFSDPVTFFERTLSYNPRNARMLTNLGAEYFASGRPDEGAALFRKAIETDPRYANAYNNLGHVCYTRGRTEEAARLFRRAIELAPRSDGAYINLGVLFSTTGRGEQGLALFRKAAGINPYDPDTFFNIGLALRLRGDTDGAREAFGRALEIDPAHARSRNSLDRLTEREPPTTK